MNLGTFRGHFLKSIKSKNLLFLLGVVVKVVVVGGGVDVKFRKFEGRGTQIEHMQTRGRGGLNSGYFVIT